MEAGALKSMSSRCLLSLSIVASAVVFATSAHAAPHTFTDAEFANGDWTVVVLQDDSLAQNADGTGEQRLTEGDPDRWRSVSNTWTNDGVDSVTLVTGQMRASSDYAPAVDGPIGSIEFSIAAETTATGTYPDDAQLVFFPVVQQGTATFAADIGAPIGNQWTSLSWGPWVAADFTRFSGSGASHPDFSTSGQPLTFGIAVQSGPLAQTGTWHLDGGIDNWGVTLNEPADGGLGGAGGAGGGAGGEGDHSTTIPPNVAPGAGKILPRDSCSCRIGDRRSGPTSAALLLGLGALGALGRGAARRRRG
jgi:hypothetical protein